MNTTKMNRSSDAVLKERFTVEKPVMLSEIIIKPGGR